MFRLSRSLLLLAAAGAVFSPPAPLRAAADPAPGWCGTWNWGIEVALAQHVRNQRRLAGGFRAQSGGTGGFEASALTIGQDGDVAVIHDDGSLIVEQNLFDYENRGTRFIRRGKNGYKVRDLGGSVRTDLGDKIALGDDDAIRVALPDFEIRYYGKSYDALYVNSDGNLTFGEPDTASTSRDIQRFLNGPPRVAPFFADLDPSAATGDGGVYVRTTGSQIIVTWWNVPEFGETGHNTIQVTMSARGNVDVRFGELVAREGIVGVAPGGGGGLELLDLSEDLPIKRRGVAMAERFTEDASIDEASVAAAFYDVFADDYDQLVMFKDFGLRAEGRDTIAYHLTVQNRVRGIGTPVYDGSRFFGSNGRLQGFVNMGGGAQYNNDVTRPGFWDLYSATDIVAHELGHQWLVGATFLDDQGRESEALLGRGSAHWNFYFDSDLSFMEGNEIRDQGNGTFTTLRRRATYNAFDLYLMGLLPASAVPDKFYVELTGAGPDADSAPAEAGVTVSGHRIDVSIDQVIAALGRRNPSVDDAAKTFRVGFIVLVRAGEQVDPSTVDKANRMATEIERLFRRETGGRGTLDTSLAAR